MLYPNQQQQEVFFSLNNGIAFVKLNRPKSLNALNKTITKSLSEILNYSLQSPEVLALVIEGEGRAFCAGGDIVSIYNSGINNTPDFDFFREEYRYNLELSKFSKPCISLWDGLVMGGGVGSSIYGSHRIATENTLFSMPEALIGFITDIGCAYFLKPLGDAIANYIALTAAKLNATDCLNFNFATHFVSRDNLELLKKDLVKALSSEAKDCIKDPKNSHNIVNKTIERYATKSTIESSLDNEKLNIIQSCFVANELEEIFSKLKKIDSNNDFLNHILESMNYASPLSLKIIFKHIKESEGLTLKEILEINNTIMTHMLNEKEFYEGVRALLIDKDKKPNWIYSNIDQIPNDVVNSYFIPVKDKLF